MSEVRPVKSFLRSMLDLLLLVAIVSMATWIIISALDKANIKAEVRIVAQEARLLDEAMRNYYERNQAYPNRYRQPRFGLLTIDPLRKRGYYRGFLPTRLRDSRIDEYDSPDDQGLNQEFWLEMTLERDPRIRFLVARSDDAPISGGQWCDGVYIYRRGLLEKL